MYVALTKICLRHEQANNLAKMNHPFHRSALKLGIAALLTSCSYLPPQKNLYFIKQDLTVYHDSGSYMPEQDQVAHKAIQWVGKRRQNADPSEKLAIVIDVDETSLSNWPYIMKYDFGHEKYTLHAWHREAKCPVIPAVKQLYDIAIQQNVTVIFISGRSEKFRSYTAKNLARAGYTKYADLLMTPDNYNCKSLIPFKSSARKSITAKGYKIIANLGDQWSDLNGGYSERTFKLPNPFYFIP